MKAFIVYDSIPQATLGMRAMQGFLLYDKTIKIQYAKTKSKVIRIRLLLFYSREGTLLNPAVNTKRLLPEAQDENMKRVKLGFILSYLDEHLEANQTLLISNLPKTASQNSIQNLFGQYEGYKEIRCTCIYLRSYPR